MRKLNQIWFLDVESMLTFFKKPFLVNVVKVQKWPITLHLFKILKNHRAKNINNWHSCSLVVPCYLASYVAGRFLRRKLLLSGSKVPNADGAGVSLWRYGTSGIKETLTGSNFFGEVTGWSDPFRAATVWRDFLKETITWTDSFGKVASILRTALWTWE